ncbi:MAG: DUF4363 family protein [Dethiobacteria bacterium]|jgi:hypothetical protein
MRKWGGWLLVLGVVVIITVSGVITQRYLDKTSGELITQLEKVGRAVEQENWEEGQHAFTAFIKSWDEVSQKWALFTDHMELDNLEMKLARLRENLHTRDKTNARADFGEALMLLKHIPDRERLTWSNVF